MGRADPNAFGASGVVKEKTFNRRLAFAEGPTHQTAGIPTGLRAGNLADRCFDADPQTGRRLGEELYRNRPSGYPLRRPLPLDTACGHSHAPVLAASKDLETRCDTSVTGTGCDDPADRVDDESFGLRNRRTEDFTGEPEVLPDDSRALQKGPGRY